MEEARNNAGGLLWPHRPPLKVPEHHLRNVSRTPQKSEKADAVSAVSAWSPVSSISEAINKACLEVWIQWMEGQHLQQMF